MAEYISYGYMLEEVAKLPQVRGVMAKPIPIQLR